MAQAGAKRMHEAAGQGYGGGGSPVLASDQHRGMPNGCGVEAPSAVFVGVAARGRMADAGDLSMKITFKIYNEVEY
jgi:hypothetical protein